MSEHIKVHNAELILGDSEEIIKRIKDIDVIFTDPPYGINVSGKGSIGGKGPIGDKGSIGVYEPRTFKRSTWDNAAPTQKIFDYLRSISKYQFFFGGNYFCLPPTRCWLIWDKMNSGNFADAEMIWTNLDKSVRIKHYMWNGAIKDATARGYEDARIHITQKPIKVCQWVLSFLPKGCRKIVDPYMGSGSIGVAAITMGYEYIGIEKDKEIFNAAQNRFKESVSTQGDLLGFDI